MATRSGKFSGPAIAIAMAASFSPPAAAQSAADVQPAAEAVVDAFHQALERGDEAAAASYLADDLLVLEGGNAERSKKEYLAHHLPADSAYSQAVSTQRTARRGGSSDTMAWVASEGRSTGTFKGTPVDRTTAETVLLRRTGEGWKITHIHWSSAAARKSN